MTQLLGPQGVPGSPADFPAQGRGLVWPSGHCDLRNRPDSCVQSCPVDKVSIRILRDRELPPSGLSELTVPQEAFLSAFMFYRSLLTWHSIHFLVVVPVQDFFKSYKI